MTKSAKRGPKPGLTLEQIARAAIAIADADGLYAVSMQRVAQAVGFTTMALYRYFAHKDELIALMIENVGPPAPDLTHIRGDWRTRLKHWSRLCSSIYRDHPWFLSATARSRTMGPNELAWVDSAMAALSDTGLPPRRRRQAFLVLIGYVRSQAEFRAMSGQSGGSIGSGKEGFEFGLECILEGIASQASRPSKRD